MSSIDDTYNTLMKIPLEELHKLFGLWINNLSIEAVSEDSYMIVRKQFFDKYNWYYNEYCRKIRLQSQQ